MTTETKTPAPPLAWHVRDWHTLGWLETGAKGVGIGAALLGAITLGASAIDVSGVGYGVVGIAGLLALGAVVQLGLRIQQRELTSLAFALANLLGHAALLWVVLTAPAAMWVPVALGGAYFVGELIKQRFLAQSGYTENGQSPQQMQWLSRVMAGMQLALVVTSLLR